MKANDAISLRTDALAAALERAARYLETDLGVVVTFPDHYWNIPAEQRYDLYKTPVAAGLTIGRASDDWAWLDPAASGGSPRECVRYDLVYLGRILQAIGEADAESAVSNSPAEP